MKLAIVGAGNAACITALSYHLHGQIRSDKIKEIEIYYDPNIPIERVGQGSVPLIAYIVSQVLGVNYYDKDNYFQNEVVRPLATAYNQMSGNRHPMKNYHEKLENYSLDFCITTFAEVFT